MGSLFDIMSIFRKPFAANDNRNFVTRPSPSRGLWLKVGVKEGLRNVVVVFLEVLILSLQLHVASFWITSTWDSVDFSVAVGMLCSKQNRHIPKLPGVLSNEHLKEIWWMISPLNTLCCLKVKLVTWLSLNPAQARFATDKPAAKPKPLL